MEEEYCIDKPYDGVHPLETCARWAMEGFNILMKNPYTLGVGSATLFPAGWRLSDRIDTSITEIHSPMPQREGNLAGSLNPGDSSCLSESRYLECSSFFIQTRPAGLDLAESLFVQDPKDFFSGELLDHLMPEYIIVRRVRKTSKRLLESGAVIFFD
ncbi:hypothetical protein GQ43DRAFT_495549 [Delitschia confertaspora ATCC 74209]|uniref:Uncharacterized protein n=1 Tax=Delitschia confertaspora ATCC 74209 TaxID=1513339 RepID=A0A9P4JEB9_9PLEO|nr:hypothetical protein GQ43DRAFT_495549 [Delitschia confertaspora ATCC 74209]